jgi:hypothetical protein
MKIKVILLYILIIRSQYLVAFGFLPSEFVFSWNIGNINNELNISENNCSYTFNAQLINYYIEYRPYFDEVGIIFEINPFKYWYFNEYNTHKMTFLNLNLFFNILNGSENYFGPFIAINWLENNNFSKFKIDSPIFNLGLKYSFRLNLSITGDDGKFTRPDYLISFIDIELAYRNIEKKHGIYIGLKIDPSIIYIPYAILRMVQTGDLM